MKHPEGTDFRRHVEAYAKMERQAMATKAGLGERHVREWLASEPGKLKACVAAHEQAL